MNNYKLSVNSSTDNLEVIRNFVTKIANRAKLPTDDIHNIEMAVDEACSNVIEHAYGYNGKKTLTVAINIKEKQFIVDIIDRGMKGFDPNSVKKVNLKEFIERRKRGGLGIHLMRNLMDDVLYFTGANNYNRVRLIKNIS